MGDLFVIGQIWWQENNRNILKRLNIWSKSMIDTTSISFFSFFSEGNENSIFSRGYLSSLNALLLHHHCIREWKSVYNYYLVYPYKHLKNTVLNVCKFFHFWFQKYNSVWRGYFIQENFLSLNCYEEYLFCKFYYFCFHHWVSKHDCIKPHQSTANASEEKR